MKLKAVSNRKLYLQIADQIRKQIEAGRVEPGQQLPSERDLALTLGVSRPTVREALIALEVAEMIEVRVGVGAFVRRREDKPLPLPELNHSPSEVMAVRRLLEPETAALASRHADDDTKAQLLLVLERMRAENAAGHWSADTDRALHLALADAAGNVLLRDFLDMLWAARSGAVDTRFHQHLSDIAIVRDRLLADHEAIVAAVVSRDADGARSAMASHIDYVAQAMTSVWE